MAPDSDSDSDSTSPTCTYLPHRDIPKDVEPLKFNGKPFEQSSKEHTTASSTVLPLAGLPTPNKPPPRDYRSDRPNGEININSNVGLSVTIKVQCGGDRRKVGAIFSVSHPKT